MDKLIIDGLSIIPYYDYYLMKSLTKEDKYIKIFVTTYTRDKFICQSIKSKIKCIDLINRTFLANLFIGKCIKVIEYIINLIIITILIYLNKIKLVHLEWLPLVTRNGFKRVEVCFLKIWKKKNIKIIYTVHNLLPHDTENKYYSNYYNVYKLCDQLICHTKFTASRLHESFGIDKSKINIIPHGPMFNSSINIEKNTARKVLNLPNKNTILLLGFIRPYKGIEFLLEVVKKIIDEYGKNINLIIVGDGKEEYINEILKKESELGIKDNITNRFEFIKSIEVQLYHYASDIIVFPYKNIDQSGALYTAMATKRPIIASDVGGFREVIKDGINGYLVKYGDVEGFKERIIKLFEDENKAKMFVLNNIELLNSKYSWKEIARKTLEVYKK